MPEPELVESGARPLLDVPVVADGGEVLLARVARLDGEQRGAGARDTERLVDAQSGVEDGVLREVTDLAHHVRPAGRRGERTGDELQQG